MAEPAHVSGQQRLRDVRRFYTILDRLEVEVGGRRLLANCDGRMAWPRRGVYFFFEPGQLRTNSGIGVRVVRVGTHAIREGSGRMPWDHLSIHHGTLGATRPSPPPNCLMKLRA